METTVGGALRNVVKTFVSKRWRLIFFVISVIIFIALLVVIIAFVSFSDKFIEDMVDTRKHKRTQIFIW